MPLKIIPLKCQRALDKEVLKKVQNAQILDSRFIAGEEHLRFAIEQAEKAFKRGENISREFLVEVLVRASAQRQIKVALETLGLRGSKKVVAICESLPEELKEYGCEISEEVLRIDGEKYATLKKTFNVAEEEIASVSGSDFSSRCRALQSIIKERIALLPAL